MRTGWFESFLRCMSSLCIEHRAKNLPEGTTQEVYLDVRGQSSSRSQINQLIDKIVEKSGGILKPENIKVLR